MKNLRQTSLFKKDLSKIHSSLLRSIFEKNKDLKFKEISSYAKIYPDSIKIIKYHRPIVFTNFLDRGNSAILMNEENAEEQDYLQKSINRTKNQNIRLCIVQ